MFKFPLTHITRWLHPAGLVLSALCLAQVCASENPRQPLTAAAQMQAAHDGRAVWVHFPGFEADIRASHQGEVVTGKLQVSAGGTIQLQLASDQKADWLERSLDSLIGHRLEGGDAIQNVTYADEPAEHPFGRLIKSNEASDHSLWRVQGDVLTEVHRINDKTHFVISVADVARNAEGKHLPQNFTVETWDRATGRLIKSRQVHTSWKRFGTFDLPVDWWAVVNTDGETRTVERIEFSGHRLLSATAAVTP